MLAASRALTCVHDCLLLPPLQVVLEGQKVLPTRAQQAGFRFKYTELQDALKNLLK